MCKVTNTLKLCTCNADDAPLKNFWVFRKYKAEPGMQVVGSVIMPGQVSMEDDKQNRKLLPELLNEGHVFDVELNPAEKDLLTLTFTVEKGDFPGRVDYDYEYTNGRWVEQSYDHFKRMENHTTNKQGKIML